MMATDFSSTIDWYNQNAKEYTDHTVGIENPVQFDDFVKLLKPGAKVLEMGCAGGRDTNLLTKQGFDALGVDISSGLIGEAKKRFPNSKFMEANFLNLPLKDESFDGIWAHMSFVHLETMNDVKKGFSEMARVLKVGGVIHFTVKAQKSEKETDIVADIYGGHKRFFRYYSLDTVRKLFEQKSFKIISLEQRNESELEGTLKRPEIDLIIALAKKY